MPNTLIEKLELWDNSIGSVGAEAIAAALPCSEIRELKLQRNGIGSEIVEAIAAAFPFIQLLPQ